MLLNFPIGHAALLNGGIIWHLTIKSLGPLAETLVLDRPSSGILKTGIAVKCSNNKESWLWNIVLLDSVKDVIYSVYRVYTSQLLTCANESLSDSSYVFPDNPDWKGQTMDLFW